MARSRLDQLLVESGLAPSRSQAQRLILAGQVRVDGNRVDKPGTSIDPAAALDVEQGPRFVSRGGDKLAAAIDARGVVVEGRVAMDIGASTGGFTDCLLQRGAAAVVAVDVGYGQLAWRLRQDARVRTLERTNARHLVAEQLPSDLPGPIDLAVVDVSFIGLAKILPAVAATTDDEAEALVLVKPQFEAGPDAVGAGGVVRDAATRLRTLQEVAAAAATQGWTVLGGAPSPLRGPAGNWECFLHLRRIAGSPGRFDPDALQELDVPDDTGNGRSP